MDLDAEVVDSSFGGEKEKEKEKELFKRRGGYVLGQKAFSSEVEGQELGGRVRDFFWK